MKYSLLKLLANVTYYPRSWIDRILYIFFRKLNDPTIFSSIEGQNCVIVGNGPSLRITPLEQISCPTIGMNKINLIFNKTTWRPHLIVCMNGLVIKQNAVFYNQTEIPLILPIKALYLGIKKRPNIYFIPQSKTHKFSDKINVPLGVGSTVTYACLQVAAWAKVRSIGLVGVDHSFKVSGIKHDIQMLKEDDENHFDPNYFKGNLWGLPDLEGSERAYSIAKTYFDGISVPVIDYTINGCLNIFPKGDITNICG